MNPPLAVTTTKVSPSGRYVWQIFECREGPDEEVTVVCESLQTYPTVYAALLAGQAVLPALQEDFDA